MPHFLNVFVLVFCSEDTLKCLLNSLVYDRNKGLLRLNESAGCHIVNRNLDKGMFSIMISFLKYLVIQYKLHLVKDRSVNIL
jgi:hypothetical protein